MSKFYVNDVGAVLEVTVTDADTSAAIDISTATVKQIRLRNPRKTTVTKAASFTTDGTDGKIRYTTDANVLNVEGLWQFQAYIELPAGRKFSTETKTFNVLGNL